MKKKSLIFFIACALCSCSSLNEEVGLKDDNLLEETVEAVIKEETGLEVDLTPSTPENPPVLEEVIQILEGKMKSKQFSPDEDTHGHSQLKFLLKPMTFHT